VDVSETRCRILFVCTGNTCRSPLAEALCRQVLAQRLGCSPRELEKKGYEVLSAGLAASPGRPASPEAIQVAQELGIDLAQHQSQPFNLDLWQQVDHLFVMSRDHLQVIQLLTGCHGPEPRLLSPGGLDIFDPFCCGIDEFRDCAQQIMQYLQERLCELVSNDNVL